MCMILKILKIFIAAVLIILAGIFVGYLYSVPLQSIACNAKVGVCSVYLQKTRFSPKIVENTFEIKNIDSYRLERRQIVVAGRTENLKGNLFKLVIKTKNPKKDIDLYTFNLYSGDDAFNFVNKIRAQENFVQRTTLSDVLKGEFLNLTYKNE